MPDDAAIGEPATASPAYRVMEVLSVLVELPDQYPVLTLREAEGERRSLSFRVGLPEGAALAHALHGTRAQRPLTHDLFTMVLQSCSADIVAVRLVGRQGATYLAELDLMVPHGREILPCRPTDGISLALRQRVPAPVLADERLLAEEGDVDPGAAGLAESGSGAPAPA